jgi:hypothetical protein
MPSMTADQAHAEKRMAPANRGAALEPSPLSKRNGTNKMSQLISLRENRSTAAICPFRQVNVRESFPMLASFVEDISDWDYPD